MKKYISCFLSLLIISSVLVGAFIPLNAYATDIAGEYIPWNNLNIEEKYDAFSWNNIYYTVQRKQFVPSTSIGKELGSVTLKTDERRADAEIKNNPKLTNKDFSQKCNLYKIKWVPSKYMIAVEYVGYEGYYIFINGYYFYDDAFKTEKSGTFGELIQATGFEHNIAFNNNALFTQSRKYVEKYGPKPTSPKGFHQNPRYYSIKNDDTLLKKFLTFSNAKIQPSWEPNTSIAPTASCVMELPLRQKYISGTGGIGKILLYDDGTMIIDLDLVGYYYCTIGEKNVHYIVDYVVNNCALIPND